MDARGSRGDGSRGMVSLLDFDSATPDPVATVLVWALAFVVVVVILLNLAWTRHHKGGQRSS